MLRCVLRCASACALLLPILIAVAANARPAVNSSGDCWIDAPTGEPVRTLPAGTRYGGQVQMLTDGRGQKGKERGVRYKPCLT